MTTFHIFASTFCQDPGSPHHMRAVLVRFSVEASCFERAIGRAWAWAQDNRYSVGRECSYMSYADVERVDLRRIELHSTQPPRATEAA